MVDNICDGWMKECASSVLAILFYLFGYLCTIYFIHCSANTQSETLLKPNWKIIHSKGKCSFDCVVECFHHYKYAIIGSNYDIFSNWLIKYDLVNAEKTKTIKMELDKNRLIQNTIRYKCRRKRTRIMMENYVGFHKKLVYIHIIETVGVAQQLIQKPFISIDSFYFKSLEPTIANQMDEVMSNLWHEPRH